MQKWEEDTWGIRLGTLLKGKALEVYNGLVDEEATSYDALTNALRAHWHTCESMCVNSSSMVTPRTFCSLTCTTVWEFVSSLRRRGDRCYF